MTDGVTLDQIKLINTNVSVRLVRGGRTNIFSSTWDTPAGMKYGAMSIQGRKVTPELIEEARQCILDHIKAKDQ